MRLRILFPVLIVAVSPVFAGGPVSFGITAGAVFSRPALLAYGQSSVSNTWTTNASFGAVIRVPLEGGLSLQSEPAYLRKGLALSENSLGSVTTINASADYVELPVFLGMSFPVGSLVPYVLIGPSVAYKLSETWDIAFAHGPPPYFYERYDVSINAGGGFLLQWGGSLLLMVQARYAFGLNQVNVSGSGELRSSEIRLNAGILINL